MSSVTFVPRQAAQPHQANSARPYKAPMQLTGRLLAQFEEDLKEGNSKRARLVNDALLELQKLMSPEQARLVEREIADAWRRACGWDF